MVGYFDETCSLLTNFLSCYQDTFPGRGKFHDLAEAFRPERFLLNDKLNPAIRDSETVAFGFGRRSVIQLNATVCNSGTHARFKFLVYFAPSISKV
jgi:hypothetical protein